MWTVEYADCDTCGTEVELLTDGRFASVSAVDSLSIESGEVFRFDNAAGLMAYCPAVNRGDEQCHGEAHFTGEGRGVEEDVQEYLTETVTTAIYDAE